MKITPAVLKGTVKIPSSKSEAHRAIICASFAEDKSTISNVTLSEDILATIAGLENLGADIDVVEDEESAVVNVNKFVLKNEKELIIDCNESGSTLRFLIPVAASLYDKVKFIGRGRLGKRPLDVFFELFKENNILYTHGEDYLPLTVEGRLSGDKFAMAGNISSQFITGVMLSSGLADKKTEISITSKLESKPYIDITQDVMDKFSVKTEYDESDNKYVIDGGGYKGRNFKVMGDWSHAGFLLLIGTKSKIRIHGLDKNSRQGDKVIVDILRSMGANIYWDGDVLVSEKAALHGKIIDVSQCPDLAPVIGAAMAVADGESVITGGERLKIKESDRIQSVADTINCLGGDAEATDDGMKIKGRANLLGGNVSCYNDHRIAMMIGSLSVYCTGDIFVDGHECVAKSYPEFWHDFKSLGGKV